MDRIIDREAPCARQTSYTLRASPAFHPFRRAMARMTDDQLADLAGDNGQHRQREAARELTESELGAAVAVELLPCGKGRFPGLVADEACAILVERMNEDMAGWFDRHWPELGREAA